MHADQKDIHEKWQQLVQERRNVWDQWNAVMDRITEAFSRFESPTTDNLDLADQLDERVSAIREKMDEFLKKRVRR